MNLISHCTRTLSRSQKGRVIYALLFLIFLLLLTAAVNSQQASTECTRKAITLRDIDLMDQPPIYNTKNGWVYGNKIGTIPRATQILICKERNVGFFGSKQVWLLVKWDAKYGWIKNEGVEEKKMSQLSMSASLFALLLPTVSAQTDSINSHSEDGKLTDPVFIGSFISILAGMVAKSLFDLFRKKRKWLGAKRFTLMMLPSLVISPIAFLGFLRTAEISLSNDLSILVVFLFAFQNGFFWEDVLNMGQAAKDKVSREKTVSSYST